VFLKEVDEVCLFIFYDHFLGFDFLLLLYYLRIDEPILREHLLRTVFPLLNTHKVLLAICLFTKGANVLALNKLGFATAHADPFPEQRDLTTL